MKIDDIHEMAHDINKYVNEHHMLKSLNQQLFDENERLNAIIDELEERIDKAIEYIKDHYNLATKEEGVAFFILRDNLLEILGGEQDGL